MVRPAISLPAPLALAALTQTLTQPAVRAAVYEPKWDGYRATLRRWAAVVAARRRPDQVLPGPGAGVGRPVA